MEQIFNIPDYGEARLSLKEYNDMREEIRMLKKENKNLTDVLDHICEENKVRVRRQIIRSRELTTNPRACGQQEIIEDRLVNFEDVKAELAEEWNEKLKKFQRELDSANADKENAMRMFDQCQRQKIDAELKLVLLQERNWWERLWNK